MLDKLGHPAEALSEYRLFISQNPTDANPHNAAGGSLAALGRYDEALMEFAQAARLNPHYIAPHVGAARILLLQGRDRDAINQLRAALRIDPDNFEILAFAAHILAANKNPAARDGQTALALAQKSNELSKGIQPMVLDILGMAYAETGDFTNAVISAQNAMELAGQARLKSVEAIRHRLELYKNQQPWRESFVATNAPEKE
jgi:tetratricopeptide (TPR) repeat protein